jgi:hypothetical protein
MVNIKEEKKLKTWDKVTIDGVMIMFLKEGKESKKRINRYYMLTKSSFNIWL